MENKKIYVYDDFSSDGIILLGILYVDNIRGNESFSFEFDYDWLKNNNCTSSLDPELSLILGR